MPARGRMGPRAYARVLDAGYEGLKAASRRNLVIGGNTFTSGLVWPMRFLRYLRLPNGRPPRLDLYGQNPFTRRLPMLSEPPLIGGAVDFGSLDEFARALRRTYGRRVRLFLSEFSVPTSQPNYLFNFYESEQTAARWLAAALRISKSWDEIYAFGWYALYDQPPRPARDEALVGLIDQQGRRKPAFLAYERG